MEMHEDGVVARVVYVSDDGYVAHLEFTSGRVAPCSSDQVFPYSAGDIVLVGESGRVERAPDEVWPANTWIGVVRLIRVDLVVVDIGGRLKKIDPPDGIDLHEGNTVEGSDARGILEVISDAPIRFLDIPGVDSHTVRQFQVPPDDELSFDHFGGSKKIVDRALELVRLPLEKHDKLVKIGARPIKGVLFTGPPGTGKTLLARIIASQTNATFYQVSGPEIMNKWVGQSEELIRKLFDDARAQDRAIIFFDEIDSLASQRSDDSHEASRRIVGQLLACMDGFRSETNVIVIATTNRPQDIDNALRRPGRFDWEICFELPGLQDRAAILEVTAPRGVEAGLPHELIAGQTESWSSADLAAIWTEAALLCVADDRDEIQLEDYIGGFERVAMQRRRVTEPLNQGRRVEK
ncbi:ATP-binding protein [Embleya sp. NPDC059259]|uniref:ATP-binding protein n=1 Tax=unclassified Embleya TaxID=2699296 RepID=UPI003679FEF1